MKDIEGLKKAKVEIDFILGYFKEDDLTPYGKALFTARDVIQSVIDGTIFASEKEISKLRDEILEMFTLLQQPPKMSRRDYVIRWQNKYGGKTCADVLGELLFHKLPSQKSAPSSAMTREEFRSIMCEHIPSIAEDSGQPEWSQGELDRAYDALFAHSASPKEVCPDCRGKGYIVSGDVVNGHEQVPCPTCHGTGSIPKEAQKGTEKEIDKILKSYYGCSTHPKCIEEIIAILNKHPKTKEGK